MMSELSTLINRPRGLTIDGKVLYIVRGIGCYAAGE